MNLLDKTINTLGKIGFDEAVELTNELKLLKLQSLNKQQMLMLRLEVMKRAHKNAAKAVEALEQLDLADEGLELVGFFNKLLTETRDELNAE